MKLNIYRLYKENKSKNDYEYVLDFDMDVKNFNFHKFFYLLNNNGNISLKRIVDTEDFSRFLDHENYISEKANADYSFNFLLFLKRVFYFFTDDNSFNCAKDLPGTINVDEFDMKFLRRYFTAGINIDNNNFYNDKSNFNIDDNNLHNDKVISDIDIDDNFVDKKSLDSYKIIDGGDKGAKK